MNGLYDTNKLNFIVEVAENGFVVTTTVPEGKKNLRKEIKAVYLTLDALFGAISSHLEDNA